MKRETATTIQLSREELEQIKTNARQYGLSMAAYIRMSALKGGIK